MLTIKHYQRSKLGNAILTFKVAMSPRVPKAKRKTLAQICKNHDFYLKQKALLTFIRTN